MKLSYISPLMLCFLFIYGCKTVQINSSSSNPLKKSDWYVSSLQIGKNMIYFNQAPELHFGDNEIQVKLDVNTCSGNYSAKNNQVVFEASHMSCTKVCCDSKEAQELIRHLINGFTLQQSDGKLVLSSTTETVIISLQKDPPKQAPQISIVGTNWYVHSAFFAADNRTFTYKNRYYVRFSMNKMEVALDVNTCSYNCSYANNQIVTTGTNFCTEACCDNPEALKLNFEADATINYAYRGDTLVLSNTTQTWYLLPHTGKQPPIENNTHTTIELAGSRWEVTSLIDKMSGKEEALEKPFYVSFEKTSISVKLDVNTCNSSCTFGADFIELPTEHIMGCTRACCDSDFAKDFLTIFHGRIKFLHKGKILKLFAEDADILLRRVD